MIQSLRTVLAVGGLLLMPLWAGAQPDDRVMEPVPPQRPIRARPAAPPAPPGGVTTPGVVPPAGPVDRSGATSASVTPEGLVSLDFEDVELAVVIDTIAKLTNKNFVYDDRVRGRVTIVSPTPIPIDQAYTVFESVLQVKGFTTVEAPGGVIKVIPIRDAKETSVDTRRSDMKGTPDTDRFVTRLIPLSYIDAEQIANTLKPLVSKEAALVAYQPTNTIILTDSAANIRRILSILEAIDVETFRQELALIRLQYADATVVADQLGELFGVDVVGATRQPGATPRARARAQPVVPGQPNVVTSPEAAQRGQVRIITDERTNSLLALASRGTLEEIRDFIRRIDVPVEGGGRIQVYYLKHADAEELADTLNSLLGGGPAGGGAAGQPGIPPQLAGQVADISSGVGNVTADPATNSLVIQASPEGYQALLRVIEQLDIARPQVLVEALIMEVTVGSGEELGINFVARLFGSPNATIGSRTDTPSNSVLTNGTTADGDDTPTTDFGDLASGLVPILAGPAGFLARIVVRNEGEDIIRAVVRATANNSDFNILSAPHILTSDNEEAEILVGNNIPIITSRVQSASGIQTQGTDSSLATSVNVERQDIGVTLRVTPQITEGETMRLDLFQEITSLNTALAARAGFDPNQVGPALSNRRIENSVVVKDGETVVIGGLIGDEFNDTVTKVPWLGDIPVLGWLFKSTKKDLTKNNLLVFLTPRVIRSPDDLEKQSIVKREEFRRHSTQLEKHAQVEHEAEEPIGVLGLTSGGGIKDPARSAVAAHDQRYPLERMLEIERQQASTRAKARAAAASPAVVKRYLVLGGVFSDPGVAQTTLTRLVDAGYEGTLVSSRASGRVMLELRVGPYTELEAAERAAEALRRGYALAPQVMVQREESGRP